MVCDSCNETLLLIIDHPNLSEAHAFCYNSADKEKMHSKIVTEFATCLQNVASSIEDLTVQIFLF